MKLRLALAASVAGLLAASAASAAPATATATASAVIVTPGSVASTRDLDFGTVAKPTTGTNTVTVNSALPAAPPVLSGGGNGFALGGGATAAVFHLVGAPGSSYTFDTPTLTFGAPAAGNLTSIGAEAPTAQAGTTLNTLPVAGTQDLYVGGHFNITSSTTPAAYTGTLSLTINFP